MNQPGKPPDRYIHKRKKYPDIEGDVTSRQWPPVAAIQFPLTKRKGGTRGPARDSGVINETNKRQILDMVIKYGREIVNEGDWPTKYGVAKRLSKYGISGRGQVAAEKAIDRLIKKCDRSWTWKNDILPRILQK